MEKLLPILNVVFAAVAMIVSIVVLVMVLGIKSSIVTPEEAAAQQAEADGQIVLSDLEELNMEDNFILTMDSAENPDKKVSVVFQLGFAIDINNDGYEQTKTTLTSQGNIIRDRIQKVLVSKDSTYYKDTTKQDELKAEILELVNGLIGTDSIKEVYFINPIYSEK